MTQAATQTTSATADDGALVKEIWVAATPETVFAFFVDPEKVCQWMGVEARIDPRPGGEYRVNVTGENVAAGEMVEISEFDRIVFTWGWEGGEVLPPGASTIEITLAVEGDGARVRLTHRGLSGELAVKHEQGWTHYMERLRIVAGGGDPGPDSMRKAA